MQLITRDISVDTYHAPLHYMMNTTAQDLWEANTQPREAMPYFDIPKAEDWWTRQARKVADGAYGISITDDLSAWLPDDKPPQKRGQELPDLLKSILPVELALWATLTDRVILQQDSAETIAIKGDTMWREIYARMDKDIRDRITDIYWPCSRQEYYDHYAHMYREITGLNPKLVDY